MRRIKETAAAAECLRITLLPPFRLQKRGSLLDFLGAAVNSILSREQQQLAASKKKPFFYFAF